MNVACLLVMILMVALRSVLDAPFSDEVELIIGELGRRFKGFS